MRYKAGDKVVVRSDLVVGVRYGNDVFVEDMAKYKGKAVTIVRVYGEKCAIKNSTWNWTEQMFVPPKDVKVDLESI